MSTNQSSKRPEIITIRVKDTELKWRLKSAAAEHRTTVSALIEQFLNDGLKALEGKQMVQLTEPSKPQLKDD